MEKADCIVVGAGPSGTACAISLTQKGFKTVLLERARQPGEKNVASAVPSIKQYTRLQSIFYYCKFHLA